MHTFNKSEPPLRSNGGIKHKRDRMEELRQCWANKWTKICCCLLILLIALAIILPIIFTQTLRRVRWCLYLCFKFVFFNSY